MKYIIGDKVIRRHTLKLYTIQNVYDSDKGEGYLIVRWPSPNRPHGAWESGSEIRKATDEEIKNKCAEYF